MRIIHGFGRTLQVPSSTCIRLELDPIGWTLWREICKLKVKMDFLYSRRIRFWRMHCMIFDMTGPQQYDMIWFNETYFKIEKSLLRTCHSLQVLYYYIKLNELFFIFLDSMQSLFGHRLSRWRRFRLLHSNSKWRTCSHLGFHGYMNDHTTWPTVNCSLLYRTVFTCSNRYCRQWKSEPIMTREI